MATRAVFIVCQTVNYVDRYLSRCAQRSDPIDPLL
jgi:hypothetical protein